MILNKTVWWWLNTIKLKLVTSINVWHVCFSILAFENTWGGWTTLRIILLIFSLYFNKLHLNNDIYIIQVANRKVLKSQTLTVLGIVIANNIYILLISHEEPVQVYVPQHWSRKTATWPLHQKKRGGECHWHPF